MAKQRVQKELTRWRNMLEYAREEYGPDGFRAYLAQAAEKDTPHIARAGEYFGLDPNHQTEAQVLLRVLAQILFPKKGRRKGTKAWSGLRLLTLAFRAQEMEAKHPRLNDSNLAKKIYGEFPDEYKSEHAVRQRLASARKQITTRTLAK